MGDLSETERRLVWIFGSPRSGSTWLMNLLAADGAVRTINEPAIGLHLASLLDSVIPVEPVGKPPVYRLDRWRSDDHDYFFSAVSAPQWRAALRTLILERFEPQVRGWGSSHAILKEPHGSLGADIVMSLLPGSRMIFLLRDGRDVIDSMLDATMPGTWLMSLLNGFQAMDRDASIRSQSYLWLWRTEAVQRAFEAHRDELKVLVRYEELLADPGPILTRLASWLGLEPEPMIELAEQSDAARLPKGRGKFLRAAAPGLWRENLSAAEQAAVHEIIGDKLRELGYTDP